MNLVQSLGNLPTFAMYLGVAIFMLGVSVIAYDKFTPYPEFDLIRENNTAAAVSLSGAMVGFACPLVAVMVYANTVPVLVMWACVGIAAQYVVFFVVSFVFRDLKKLIVENKIAPAIFLAATHVSTGILIAAAMAE